MTPLNRDNTVLLFFKEFETDSFFPYDRYLKRWAKPLINRIKRGQKISGFSVWCQLLQTALKQEGYEVHLNNYALAYHNPQHPVGLIGYPHLLDGWSLPNPAILGPAMHDHPALAPNLMKDPRYHRFIVTCDWMASLFEQSYPPQKVGRWYGGINLGDWPDTRYHPKDIDILLYDKIRWNHALYEERLLRPILDHCAKQKLRVHTIRYKHYDHKSYRQLLSRSRTMLFLCEHETQGMAYQEALASNVPILAWDQGWWLDPQRLNYTTEPIPACSVPYFSAECGETFSDIESFTPAFGRFWAHLDQYEPRQFVERELSLKGSAELFMKHYRSAMIPSTIA